MIGTSACVLVMSGENADDREARLKESPELWCVLMTHSTNDQDRNRSFSDQSVLPRHA